MGLLKDGFAPSQDEVWRQLSENIQGKFVAGDFWHENKVVAHVGEWPVTIDIYHEAVGSASVTYTRLRAPYINTDGLRFHISHRSVFSGVGKWLGMQDIEVGDSTFDEEFILQGTNPDEVKALLADPDLRRRLLTQPSLQVQVKDDEGWFTVHFPKGVDELCLQVLGEVKDVNRLQALYDLFAGLLNQMCRIGSAYASDPHVELT